MRRFDCELRKVFEATISHFSHNRRVMIENTLSLQRGGFASRIQGISQKLPLSSPEPLTSTLPHPQFSTLLLKMLSNRVHYRKNASKRSQFLVEAVKLSPR